MSKTKSTLRASFYRSFFRVLVRVIKVFVVSKDRRINGELIYSSAKLRKMVSIEQKDVLKFWFHAASVGELESLWPLIELSVKDEKNVQVVVTVFSESADRHLKRMREKLPVTSVLFTGYSPWEGDWKEILKTLKPHLFITAKYEAWPDLWMSLSELGIPLTIVGAKARSSLITAKKVLNILGVSLPKLELFTFSPNNTEPLKNLFHGAQVYVSSDPRWDRVFDRKQKIPQRVNELKQIYNELEKPWKVLGSVWSQDLKNFLKYCNEDLLNNGTLWLFPHKLDAVSLTEIEILVRDMGLTPVRSTGQGTLKPAGKIAVIVDEMGFLAEWYSACDWAYVGGGFGAGVHSTIEPAVYGLPIFCGPNGNQKFDEIEELKSKKQLSVLTSEKVWRQAFLESAQVNLQKENWETAARSHAGVSVRIWEHCRRVAEAQNFSHDQVNAKDSI